MKIYVFSNFKDDSRNALRELTSLLDEFGFEMLDEYSEEADVLSPHPEKNSRERRIKSST